MGVTLAWRGEPPDRDAKTYGRRVELRAGRATAGAYLACSDRVGPGLLILDAAAGEDARALADTMCAEGFTALVPELPEDGRAGLAVAAAHHLVDNWHPRLGVLALHGMTRASIELARTITLDAIVALEPSEELDELESPTLVASDLAEAIDFLLYHAS